MSTITSASILIDVLGGNHKVAAITGSRPSAVSNWRKGKLPAATYVILRTKIERMGLQVRDELWAMRTKPRGKTLRKALRKAIARRKVKQ